MKNKKQLHDARDDNFYLEEELENNSELSNQMGLVLANITSTAIELTKIVCEKDTSIQSKEDVLEAFAESFEEVETSITSMSL